MKNPIASKQRERELSDHTYYILELGFSQIGHFNLKECLGLVSPFGLVSVIQTIYFLLLVE